MSAETNRIVWRRVLRSRHRLSRWWNGVPRLADRASRWAEAVGCSIHSTATRRAGTSQERWSQPTLARRLATLLVPEERSSAPFFPDSARDPIFAVLLGLGVAGNPKWDFRDLICALDSRERIRGITARHGRAKVIAERILCDERHSFGVLSSLGTKIVRFESVAALWNTARRQLEAAIADIVSRRREIQFAADAEWPHTDSSNAGIRAEFQLPSDRVVK